jgi:sec-independent protein translocase protein TatC
MAEEPGDDREEREPITSASDDSPDADTDDGGDTSEERAAQPDDSAPDDSAPDDTADGEADATDEAGSPDDETEDSEYFVPPGEVEDEPVEAIQTDEEFNSLHAGDDVPEIPDDAGLSDPEVDDSEYFVPPEDESDEASAHECGDLSEAYGMPSSDVSDEERARWAGETDEDAELRPDADPDEAPGEATANAAVDADAPASDGGYADENDPYATYEDYELGGGDDEPAFEGAPDDREMPLADHIEEMVKRLGVVVIVMAVVSGIVFPFGTDLINFLWYSYLPGAVEQCPGAAATAQNLGPGDAACPRVYHPLAVILARLKVATLAGFLVALPVFVYETYLFMRPGLYPKERRYYLASVPTSLVLAAVGVAFAHFLVIPAIFTYFVYYSDSATTIAFGLTETFDLMILLMGGFAIVFQIPLFIMLALMMGLVTRQWMADRRLIFWGVYAGLAFLFSPDPTGMAPIIVAATMITLHEGTLLLAKWTGRK